MTPEPRDLLRGARATLAEVVLPALTDPFAIEQLKTVLRVIVHLDAVIDDAYALEWAEARDLAEVLGDSVADFAAAPPATYRALRDANIDRKRRVVAQIREASAAGSAPNAPLVDYVRHQTERERRWTRPKTSVAQARGDS